MLLNPTEISSEDLPVKPTPPLSTFKVGFVAERFGGALRDILFLDMISSEDRGCRESVDSECGDRGRLDPGPIGTLKVAA